MFNKTLQGSIALTLTMMSFIGNAYATDTPSELNSSFIPLAESSEVEPAETINAFAQRKLYEASSTSTPDDVGIELIFIQTIKGKKIAHVLVDDKYGKDVRAGESVKGWKVSRIANDGITLLRGSRRQTLLLESDATLFRAASGRERFSR